MKEFNFSYLESLDQKKIDLRRANGWNNSVIFLNNSILCLETCFGILGSYEFHVSKEFIDPMSVNG